MGNTDHSKVYERITKFGDCRTFSWGQICEKIFIGEVTFHKRVRIFHIDNMTIAFRINLKIKMTFSSVILF